MLENSSDCEVKLRWVPLRRDVCRGVLVLHRLAGGGAELGTNEPDTPHENQQARLSKEEEEEKTAAL